MELYGKLIDSAPVHRAGRRSIPRQGCAGCDGLQRDCGVYVLARGPLEGAKDVSGYVERHKLEMGAECRRSRGLQRQGQLVQGIAEVNVAEAQFQRTASGNAPVDVADVAGAVQRIDGTFFGLAGKLLARLLPFALKFFGRLQAFAVYPVLFLDTLAVQLGCGLLALASRLCRRIPDVLRCLRSLANGIVPPLATPSRKYIWDEAPTAVARIRSACNLGSACTPGSACNRASACSRCRRHRGSGSSP
jgi:hypothetical protein